MSSFIISNDKGDHISPHHIIALHEVSCDIAWPSKRPARRAVPPAMLVDADFNPTHHQNPLVQRVLLVP
jgi:hypothetical protein